MNNFLKYAFRHRHPKIDWIAVQYRFVAWLFRRIPDNLLSIVNEISLVEMDYRGHIVWEFETPETLELEKN